MKDLIVSELGQHISSWHLDSIKPKLTIYFFNGYLLHIRYNDFGEYSYQFTYSRKLNDRFRFDNYDDRWNVKSKPHHLHEKNSNQAIKSPMVGDPSKDGSLLLVYIRKNVKF